MLNTILCALTDVSKWSLHSLSLHLSLTYLSPFFIHLSLSFSVLKFSRNLVIDLNLYHSFVVENSRLNSGEDDKWEWHMMNAPGFELEEDFILKIVFTWVLQCVLLSSRVKVRNRRSGIEAWSSPSMLGHTILPTFLFSVILETVVVTIKERSNTVYITLYHKNSHHANYHSIQEKLAICYTMLLCSSFWISTLLILSWKFKTNHMYYK